MSDTKPELTTDTPWEPANIELSRIDQAFCLADRWQDILPPFKQLPKVYREVMYHHQSIPSVNCLNDWFSFGIKNLQFSKKPKVDDEVANRVFQVVQAIMGSWGPKHEHKIGGLAFILDSYFTTIKYEAHSPTSTSE